MPTKVGTDSDWVQVSAGRHCSAAINSKGELYSWGSNDRGRTGLGTAAGDTLVPTRVGTESNWTQVSAGQGVNICSAAINNKGELYSWGSNASGGTGLGLTTGNTLVPTRVGTESNWTQVVTGGHSEASNHSLALNSKGELYSWGLGTNGQLGHGTVAV